MSQCQSLHPDEVNEADDGNEDDIEEAEDENGVEDDGDATNGNEYNCEIRKVGIWKFILFLLKLFGLGYSSSQWKVSAFKFLVTWWITKFGANPQLLVLSSSDRESLF